VAFSDQEIKDIDPFLDAEEEEKLSALQSGFNNEPGAQP